MIHAANLSGKQGGRTHCGCYVLNVDTGAPGEVTCPECAREVKLASGRFVLFNGRPRTRAECAVRLLTASTWRGATVSFRTMANGSLALVAKLDAASLELFDFDEETRAEFARLWTAQQEKRKRKPQRSEPKSDKAPTQEVNHGNAEANYP